MSVLFSGFMREWIGARDKQIAWTKVRFSDDLFALRFHSFPHESRKKDIHSLYLQCFQQRPFLKFSEKSLIQNSRSNRHLTSFDVLFIVQVIYPNAKLLVDSGYWKLNRKILGGLDEGNMILFQIFWYDQVMKLDKFQCIKTSPSHTFFFIFFFFTNNTYLL